MVSYQKQVFTSGTALISILIVFTAPLEKLNWQVGFTLRPVMLLSFAAFYLWVLKSLSNGFKLRKDLRKLLLVFFLMTLTFLLASINSLEPIKSVRHVILYGTLFLLAFVIIESVKEFRHLTIFVKAWMLVGVIMCLYGILQFVGPFYGFDIDKVFFGF